MIKRVVLTLLVLALASAHIWADEDASRPVKVPFELLKSQHMVVQVKVNGKGPFRLIFDTGAPVTLINNKVATQGNALPKGPRPLFAPFGALGPTRVQELEVGGLKAENMPAIIMDHPVVEAISKFVGPIDGIVGFSFWARYRMTIDYQAKELTFVPVKYTPPDALKSILTSLGGTKGKAGPRVLAPAGQWGIRVAKDADDAEAGVTVKDVLPGSAAAAAGLQAGDRLLVLDGRWTDTVNDCYAAAAKVAAGATVRVKIARAGKEMQLTVTVRAGL
jgi:hypothetical protein